MPIDEKAELESQYQDDFEVVPNEKKKKAVNIIKSGKRTNVESALGVSTNATIENKPPRDNSQGSGGAAADTSLLSNHSNNN